MSNVKIVMMAEGENGGKSGGTRIQIESAGGKNEIALNKGDLKTFDANYSDKLTCVYGTAQLGLIFHLEHNGVGIKVSAIPKQNERREIILSASLLYELLSESRRNSPKAPPIDLNGTILLPSGVYGR